jgi:hypothetical protein
MSIRHRLRRLEHVTAQLAARTEPADQHAYNAAWTEAFDVLVSTMSPEHLELVGEAYAARETNPEWHWGSTREGRLLREFESRITARVGPGPEWQVEPRDPERPLGLPSAVAEMYMAADEHAGLQVRESHECTACHLRVPMVGRNEATVRDESGVWRWLDGETVLDPCPNIWTAHTDWRYLQQLTTCPLCGGSVRMRADWNKGMC